jgi:hypothetical protein
MTPLQIVQITVGSLLLLVVMIFFMYVVVKMPTMPHHSYSLLRWFATIGGGFAGGLIMGPVLANASQNIPGGNVTASGGAGGALAIIVFFLFPKWRDPAHRPVIKDVVFTVPHGCSFEAMANTLVTGDPKRKIVDCSALTPAERATKLRSQEITASSTARGLLLLRHLAETPIRAYEVVEGDSEFQLRIV